MANLTQTSALSRKAIKYGSVGFLLVSVLWYLGVALVNYYISLHPPPLPPASVDFGKLQAIEFPKNESRPQMVLELPTGVIPTFPDRMRVYYAPTKRSGFADPDNATEVATALGFLFKPDQPTESRYIWSNQDQLSSKLDMNIVTGHFVLTKQWQNNPLIATFANFVSDKQVITDTSNSLRKSGILEDDLLGFEKLTYLKSDAGKLIPALSLSDADFVQLDYFRKNIDEIDPESKTKEIKASYPFYRTDPSVGLLRVIVSGSKQPNEKIIEMKYSYTFIKYEENGTYPIKTGDEAWQELLTGGGFVAPTSPMTGEVKIRKIFLAYYDSNVNQKYAMPIYVFLGDKGFAAYVSAVNDRWIEGGI